MNEAYVLYNGLAEEAIEMKLPLAAVHWYGKLFFATDSIMQKEAIVDKMERCEKWHNAMKAGQLLLWEELK